MTTMTATTSDRALPSYHVDMMNDKPRNLDYERGIESALQKFVDSRTRTRTRGPARNDAEDAEATVAIDSPPPIVILDLGCGAGLLTMLAARAARRLGVETSTRIVGCERDPPLAKLATSVAEANGCAPPFVTIHPTVSSALNLEPKASIHTRAHARSHICTGARAYTTQSINRSIIVLISSASTRAYQGRYIDT